MNSTAKPTRSSPVRPRDVAFDLSAEDSRIRDFYGRHDWGQAALLTRQLVEAGSTFVTAHFGGWDYHWNMDRKINRHLPCVSTFSTFMHRTAP